MITIEKTNNNIALEHNNLNSLIESRECFNQTKAKINSLLIDINLDKITSDSQTIFIQNLVFFNKSLLTLELTLNPINYNINLYINESSYSSSANNLGEGLSYLKTLKPILKLYSDILNVGNN